MSHVTDSSQSPVWLNALEFFFERVLTYVSAIVMFVMMLVTLVDVVGRDLFQAPLPGGFEITELLLAALIFLGLPIITAEGGHVDVDLLDSITPPWFKAIQAACVTLVSTVCFGILSWTMWRFAIRTYEYQDTTAVLQIPYSGLVFLMAICCTLATFALCAMLALRKYKALFTVDKAGEV